MKRLFVRPIALAGLLLQLGTLCFHARGAAGDVDLSFDPGFGVNGTVNAIVVQPDGKVIIGGEFTMVKGLVYTNLARLNADGSGDSSFVSQPLYYPITSLALQSDGKVLIGSKNDVWDVSLLKRLNSDGSPDVNFNANAGGLALSVYCIVVQPDGKILYSVVDPGEYDADPHLIRLNPNGTRDTNFTALGGYVYSMALQADGKVIASGYSLNYNGNYGILRINPNGGIDNTFISAVSNLVLESIVLQADGKVVIGGGPFWVNETNLTCLARLNADGSVDSAFSQGPGAASGVSCIALQAGGKILIGGGFTAIQGHARTNVARLNADGSLDLGFQNGMGGVGGDGDPYYNPPSVRAIALQTNGKILIGGAFTTANGSHQGSMARFNSDGSLDPAFQPGQRVGPLSSLIVQADGKILVGGVLTFINGTNLYGSARLNADGSPDNTFAGATNFHPDLLAVRGYDDCLGGTYGCAVLAWASAVAVQPDSKVIVGGVVRTEISGDNFVDYIFRSILHRFYGDGSPDTNFSPVFGELGSGGISKVIVQPDGKLLVCGSFTTVNGTNRPGLARLNISGTLDLSFAPATGASSIALQPDGKVLIAGHGFARLNANGSFDNSFNSITGTNGTGSSLALQPDGKVLIAGSFTNVNGTNLTSIARLNANGSLDTTFKPGTTGDRALIHSIALQANGDVLIGGGFPIALRPDGNMLIGGAFQTINGVLRPYVARLYGDSFPPSLNITRSNAFVIVSWPTSGLSFQLQETTNLSLPNSWSLGVQPAVTNAGQISVLVPITAGQTFFRLKSQ